MVVGRFITGAVVAASIVLLSTLALSLLKAIQILPGPDGAELRHLRQTNPLFMLVVVAAEELLFRSLLVGLLSERIGVPLAVTTSALVMFLVHVPNGPQSLLTFANLVLFTIVASQLYLQYGYLAALGFHWGWNLVQWTILGYPMYQRHVGRWLHVVPVGATWLSGGAFGLENSLIAALGLATTALLLALAR